jgi:hypothetical protein
LRTPKGSKSRLNLLGNRAGQIEGVNLELFEASTCASAP